MTQEPRAERERDEMGQQRYTTLPPRGYTRQELTAEEVVANIRAEGVPLPSEGRSAAERYKLMKDGYGFRMGEKAEYVILESCTTPFYFHDAVKALKSLLDYFEVDYTLLPKAYCCANSLLLKGTRARDQEQISNAYDISKSIADRNIEQAKDLGARTVVTLCQGCDSVYRLHKDSWDLEVIWYPELIERLFTGGKLQLKADYYAGCYRLDAKLANPNQPNLDSALRVMERIEGLQLNQLSNRWCCMKTKELDTLVSTLENDVLITICTACYYSLSHVLGVSGLHGRENNRIKMLTEVVWDAVKEAKR